MSSTAPTSVSTLYAIPTITSYINVGPMTTAINFPANCRNDVYDFGESGIGLPYSYYTQGCALSSCCPSNHVYSSAFEWYSYYYSPAVCPFGYTQGPVDPIISTASGENARWCCPTDFEPLTANSYPSPTTTPYLNWLCQRQYYNLSSTAYVYDNIFNQRFVSTETINSYFYAAFPIQIRWREGDFDSTTTSEFISSGVSSSSGLIPTSTSKSIPTSARSAHQPLSTGAIVAIAVVLGLLSLAAVAVGLWWSRRRSQKLPALLNSGHRQHNATKPKSFFEKDSRPIFESGGDARGSRMHGANEPVELDVPAHEPAELGSNLISQPVASTRHVR